jgi:hypothetical protein
VQVKLEGFLPSATDSVLCDYVLVMLGNRKTSRQVALDLEVSLCVWWSATRAASAMLVYSF